MCYSYGAVETYISTCPMCKVFPSPRCPHQRDVCRNRANHPRMDVLYLKNAEMELFNGCGYCKWAKTCHSTKSSGFNNQGYPGCCRPPTPNEYRLIRPTEWIAVNTIHHTPIPREVRHALDKLSQQPSTTTPSRPTGPKSKPSTPPLDRKNSGNSTPQSRSGSALGKIGGSPSIPIKTKSGGSPESSNAGSGSSGSPSNSPRLDLRVLRDALPFVASDKKDPRNSRTSSPARKSIEIERGGGSTPKKPSSKPFTSTGTPPPRGEGKLPTTPTSGYIRSSSSAYTPASGSRSKNSSSIHLDRVVPSSPAARSPSKPPPPPALSSGASSAGSDSTITSEGAFTDYLSDESEAELQRQAEAKAALVAQNQVEEMEFKAARQRLVGVDLHPDEHWRGTNITNSTLAPRLPQPVLERT